MGCTEFSPVTYSDGKEGVTPEEVIEAMKDKDNPLGRGRNLLGDTKTTKGQVDVYMAQRKALCK